MTQNRTRSGAKKSIIRNTVCEQSIRHNCKDAPHSGSAGSRGVRSGLVFEHFCKLSQVRSKWETHLLVIALSYSVAMTQLLLI